MCLGTLSYVRLPTADNNTSCRGCARGRRVREEGGREKWKSASRIFVNVFDKYNGRYERKTRRKRQYPGRNIRDPATTLDCQNTVDVFIESRISFRIQKVQFVLSLIAFFFFYTNHWSHNWNLYFRFWSILISLWWMFFFIFLVFEKTILSRNIVHWNGILLYKEFHGNDTLVLNKKF